MQVSIRKAVSGDFKVCTRLMLEIHAIHVEHEPWLIRMPEDGRIWSVEEFGGLVAGSASAVLLAEADGDVVGLAQLLLKWAPDLPIITPRLSCSVESLCVTAAWQDRGIGRLLMAAAEGWAVENDADDLTLSVHDFNQGAIRFYRRLGYEDFLHRMRRPLKR